MKCESAQEIIALAVYGELPDDQGPQLEQHLLECEACRRELEAVQALSKAMSLASGRGAISQPHRALPPSP